MCALPNLSGLSLGEPTGEFYPVPKDEARELFEDEYEDCHTCTPIPVMAERDDDNATFRLPLPETTPKNADGSYKYRVYDAASLWRWVRQPGRATDPVDRTPLLRSDWEALRDRYSNADADPTPRDRVFRRPITDGRWPPGVPYVPPPPRPPRPPPTLTHDTLTWFVRTVTLLNDLGDLTVRSIERRLERDQGVRAGAFRRYRQAIKDEVKFWLPLAVLYRANAGIHDGRPLGIFEFPTPLRDDTIQDAVRVAYEQGGPHYNHPTYGPIAGWAVHEVTNMDELFGGPSGTYRNFNPDLSRWDVRHVTSMHRMFWDANAFNGDLSRWSVFHVTNMNRMFLGATAFEGEGLNRWAVNSVTDMESMFQGCPAFHADLSLWNVGNVRNMKAMFAQTTAFNGDLERWEVHNVRNMEEMFYQAWGFEGKGLDRWEVRNVTNMNSMFEQARAFNADLSRWDVRNVETMQAMFDGATRYDPEHPLGSRRAFIIRRRRIVDDSDDEGDEPSRVR